MKFDWKLCVALGIAEVAGFIGVSRDGGRFSHAAQAAVSRLDQHLAGIPE